MTWLARGEINIVIERGEHDTTDQTTDLEFCRFIGFAVQLAPRRLMNRGNEGFEELRLLTDSSWIMALDTEMSILLSDALGIVIAAQWLAKQLPQHCQETQPRIPFTDCAEEPLYTETERCFENSGQPGKLWELLQRWRYSSTAQHHPKPNPPAGPTSTMPSNFLNLPPDIHLQILSHLDYKSFTHTMSTCQHLHNLSNKTLTRTIIARSETHHPEMFKPHICPLSCVQLLPCYACLRVRRTEYFFLLNTLSAFYLGKSRCRERVCSACDRGDENRFAKKAEEEGRALWPAQWE
jgi:F-box domain